MQSDSGERMRIESLDERLGRRIEGLSHWLKENAPDLADQAHLDEGSSERAYWHAGYLQALRDVLALLGGDDRSLN